MKSHDSSSPSAPNDNVTPSNVSESQAPSNASISLTPPSITVTHLNASVSPSPPNVTVSPSNANVSSTRSVQLEEKELIYDVEKLNHDPAKRDSIMKYPPNERDAVRRAYILKKPCQPRSHKFPRKYIGGSHRFMPYWFDIWDWLEYSTTEDAAFCFVCYLFKNEVGLTAGGDAYVNKGFKSWNKPDKFIKHIGGVKSAHNLAYEKYVNLRDGKKKSIIVSLDNATEVTIREYDIRLKASISCLRYLLRQGLSFCGHRENSESLIRGNFLELLKWLRAHNEVVSKVTLENAPGNCQLISPTIQKDTINCCAKETTKQIVDELGVDYFAILADESSDVSATISLLMEHSLTPSKIRGQGYDGASNMKGEIHGLQTLIMEDTPSAYYVHCFAHQLQLTLVAIAKKNDECAWLFDTVAMLLNVVGVSCKRSELIREIQAQKLAQALEVDELETGSGLNQELGLKRSGDTRWSSHYKTLLNVMDLFSIIFKVLMIIGKDDSKSEDKCKAQSIFYSMESFHFVFMARLMTTIFGYTNNLCLALQRRDQDIINAMRLVSLTKCQLQKMREDGWEIHLNKVDRSGDPMLGTADVRSQARTCPDDVASKSMMADGGSNKNSKATSVR
ncbi:zinc finger MYM-type protein 1-like [Salvia splendens]|uniref:zinc finger MYM-type protein 1-like n=1 Tax=Salvia splendens TaxID=180675 RepID=UPI001C27EC44|nr:zinc finger MYM-type protein 1-like [Salvia splendens]